MNESGWTYIHDEHSPPGEPVVLALWTFDLEYKYAIGEWDDSFRAYRIPGGPPGQSLDGAIVWWRLVETPPPPPEPKWAHDTDRDIEALRQKVESLERQIRDLQGGRWDAQI